MRVNRQVIFEFLNEATEIVIPSNINRIIVDYLLYEASHLLGHELDLYKIFIEAKPNSNDLIIVNRFRKQFTSILEKIILGEEECNFLHFGINLYSMELRIVTRSY